MSFAYTAVIPAHNAAATIRQAVTSVLDQTLPPAAVVVVDDGSSDGTADVLADMGHDLTVVRQENRGPGAATTAGLARVATPFFATLDADDLWLPHKMARQAELFERDPDLAGAFALGRLFRDGAAPDAQEDGPVQRLWTRTTLVFRTDKARAAGDIVDLPGLLGELIEWLARGRDLGHRHAMAEEVLALRRIHPGSLSHSTERRRGYVHAIRTVLERRRQAAAEAPEGSH